MARLELTPHLSRHLHCEPFAAPAATVRDLLGIAFTRCPELQTYLLDERGCVRPHVVIFLDGQPIRDRQHQSDTVQEQSSVFVMQALSGG